MALSLPLPQRLKERDLSIPFWRRRPTHTLLGMGGRTTNRQTETPVTWHGKAAEDRQHEVFTPGNSAHVALRREFIVILLHGAITQGREGDKSNRLPIHSDTIKMPLKPH